MKSIDELLSDSLAHREQSNKDFFLFSFTVQINRKTNKTITHSLANEIYKINDPKSQREKKKRNPEKLPKFYYSTPKHTSECPLNDINLYTL